MPPAGLPNQGLIKHNAKHWHYPEELPKRCSSSKLLGATEVLYLLNVLGWMCCLFVYLHFMDCLHVLLSTLTLSLRFVPANHRQLSLPSSAWKSLEKVVVYKAASDKEKNSCKPTGLWLELVPSQYRTSSVIGGGPITEDEGESYCTKSFREAALILWHQGHSKMICY